MKKINLVIFGATGSIGQSTLAIVKKNPKLFNIEGVTCNSNIKKLIKIAKEFNIKKVGFNSQKIKNKSEKISSRLKVYDNIKQFQEIITPKTDFIIFAISGLEGMNLLLQIVCLGKKIGIANKECIISLGKNLFNLANKYNTEIIPLDSEHNAIYHLSKYNNYTFNSVTITATGGPFRSLKLSKFKDITIKDALKHPVWKMGKKISIDSATMMNKALELIEATSFFDLSPEKVNAIIHPQAIVHAMINYNNGSTTALLSQPSMQIPIASLFFEFETYSKVNKVLDLKKIKNLEFYDIDNKRFPAIKLGYEVMNEGGLFPNTFNYINELLVNKFLNGSIKFTDIISLNRINLDKTFNKNSNIANPNINDINNINCWIDKNLFIG